MSESESVRAFYRKDGFKSDGGSKVDDDVRSVHLV